MQRDDSKWPHARWCDGCEQYHGLLYLCDSYSAELKGKIMDGQRKYKSDLSDPQWCDRQLRNGMPPEVLAIFKAMAGVTDE